MNTLGPSDHQTLPVQSQSYTPDFFAASAPRSLSSALTILDSLFRIHLPTSVVDIGCGPGTWLAAAERLGATQLVGIDGPWVDPKTLASERIQFRPKDLGSPFELQERFDLCISVEVAEHLAAAVAPQFVRLLCATSDVVLFSAAIPNQGGVMHVNERPQSYWAALFAESGYDCHDLFRGPFWHDSRVDPWYRQNILLYVRRTLPLGEILRNRHSHPGPLDIVHPDIFASNLETYKRAAESPTLAYCCQSLARWGKRQVWKLRSK